MKNVQKRRMWCVYSVGTLCTEQRAKMEIDKRNDGNYCKVGCINCVLYVKEYYRDIATDRYSKEILYIACNLYKDVHF